MALQEEKLDLVNKATLTPELFDAQNATIGWASAQTYMNATATWTHAAVDGFGAFTVAANGVATFVPNAEGKGTVTLKVTYTDTDGTPGEYTQDLEIEVIEVFTPTGMNFDTTVSSQ